MAKVLGDLYNVLRGQTELLEQVTGGISYGPGAAVRLLKTTANEAWDIAKIVEIEGNLDAPEWDVQAAKIMLDVMAQAKK